MTQAADDSIRITTVFNTSPAEVFSYFTEPERLALWHAPNLDIPPTINVDLRPGGQGACGDWCVQGNSSP